MGEKAQGSLRLCRFELSLTLSARHLTCCIVPKSARLLRPSSSASRYHVYVGSSTHRFSSNFSLIHALRRSPFSPNESFADFTSRTRDGPSPRHSPFSSAEAIADYAGGIRDGPPPPDSWRAFAAAAASGGPGGPSLAHLHQLLEARWSAELGRPRCEMGGIRIDLMGKGD